MLSREPTERWTYDRFDLVFVVTVVTVGLLLLVDLNQTSGLSELLSIVVTFLTAATLLLAILASGIGRRVLQFALVATGLTVGTAIMAAFAPIDTTAGSGGGLLWLMLVVAAPVIVLRRVLSHKEVRAETILGALAVYLMLALAATYLFLFLDAWLDGSGRFFGEAEPTTVFMYFSLVTLTTLGYGDFQPVTEFARAASVWEAVIGQIFLVVIVARLVSVYSRDHGDPTDDAIEDSD